MQRSPSRLHTRTRPQAHQERSRCLHIRMDRCTHTQAGAFGATCESFASCSHISSLPHTSQRVGSAGLHMQMQHRCTTARACKRRTHSCVRVRPCAWVYVLCVHAAASGRWALRTRADRSKTLSTLGAIGWPSCAASSAHFRPAPICTRARGCVCSDRRREQTNTHSRRPNGPRRGGSSRARDGRPPRRGPTPPPAAPIDSPAGITAIRIPRHG
jgi:hypothetical protein